MTSIDQIADHLTALGLRFRRRDDRIDVGFDGDNVTYEAAITARPGLVSVLAWSIAVIPEARIDETIRLANLVNATRLSYGTFWVEPDDRRLAFEVPIPAPDGSAMDQVRMAMRVLGAIDVLYPAFARVIWGGMDARSALECAGSESPTAESGPEDPPLDIAV